MDSDPLQTKLADRQWVDAGGRSDKGDCFRLLQFNTLADGESPKIRILVCIELTLLF